MRVWDWLQAKWSPTTSSTPPKLFILNGFPNAAVAAAGCTSRGRIPASCNKYDHIFIQSICYSFAQTILLDHMCIYSVRKEVYIRRLQARGNSYNVELESLCRKAPSTTWYHKMRRNEMRSKLTVNAFMYPSYTPIATTGWLCSSTEVKDHFI